MTLRSLVLAACGASLLGGQALAQDKVQIRLDWAFGSEHAPIFLAKKKGFFAEEGIDVDIRAGEGSTVTVRLVGNRTTQFGFAAADQMLMAHGRELPVVSLAVMLQKSPAAIIFPASSGIKTLKDLYGKKLGVPIRSTVEKQWRVVANMQGIDTSKINEVPTDAIAALIANKTIDASVAFFYNDGIKLRTQGIPTDWILFADVGLPIYALSLITHEALIKENPGLVRRFTRAFMRGWTYTMQHPQEAIDIFLKENPTAEAEYSRQKLPEVLKLTQTDDTKAHGLGYSTKERWETIQDILIKMGLMRAPVDVTKVFTNEFLKN